jgi:hypothetical protein
VPLVWRRPWGSPAVAARDLGDEVPWTHHQ